MSALHARYRQLALESRQQRALSYPVLFWLFIAGSLLGTVAEGLFHLMRKGVWGFRVGTVWGPFCVLYGFGTAAMYLVALTIRQQGLVMQFAAFALAGTVVEYAASVLQECCFGTMSWDYSAHAMNISGRVSLRMTLLWGMAGIALMYLLLPILLLSFNRLHLDQRRLLCAAMSAFMCLNLLLTSAALLRWQERTTSSAPASNAVEAYLDQHWPDERLRERFPNMEFVSAAELDI